ncbi:MAG TPA: hypothetical protein VEI97_10830 [bacterium]|nr:hypothetical protein [bacterium]
MAGRGQEAGKGGGGVEVEAREEGKVPGQDLAVTVAVLGVEGEDGAELAGEAAAELAGVEGAELGHDRVAEQLRGGGGAAELPGVLAGTLQRGGGVEAGLVGEAGGAGRAVGAEGDAREGAGEGEDAALPCHGCMG